MSKYDNVFKDGSVKAQRIEVSMAAEADPRSRSRQEFDAANEEWMSSHAQQIESLQRQIESLIVTDDPFPIDTTLLAGNVKRPEVFVKDAEGVWFQSGYVAPWPKVLQYIRGAGVVRMVLSYRDLPGGEVVEVERKRQTRKASSIPPKTKAGKDLAEAKKERYARAAATRKANREAKAASTES